VQNATNEISLVGLAWTILLILISLGISRWQNLGLEKRLLIGCIRAALQLFAIGYVLGYILKNGPLWMVLLASAFQLALAAWTAGSLQSPPLRGSRLIALLALMPAYLLVISVLLFLVIRPEPLWNARYVLPLGGMLLGNAMTAVALAMNRFRSECQSNTEMIISRLALGASWRQAVAGERRSAAHAAMLPTVSGLLTVGLVSLPGMMTGQVIAGQAPEHAVRYQIMVMFMIGAVVAVATALALEAITRRGKLEAPRRQAN
jgi:putative ABC transport system permease protein